jgi:hypothetical protein
MICEKNLCLNYSVKDLDNIIYLSKKEINELSKNILNNLYYGYCKNISESKSKISKLRFYTDVLQTYKKNIIFGGVPCSNINTFNSIIEKVKIEVGSSKCNENKSDIIIDEKNLEKYLLSSPQCVSYDSWNKFSRGLCGEIGFKITVEKEICDITFEIVKKIIPCDLLFNIKVYKEACDLNYKIKRSKEDCKIDYKLLSEKYNCFNISLNDYFYLVKDKNISFSLIDEVYKSELELEIINNRACLVSKRNVYDIEKIAPTSLTKLTSLGYKVSAKKSNILKEYTQQ